MADNLPNFKKSKELTEGELRDVFAAMDRASATIRPEHRGYLEGYLMDAMRKSGSMEKLSREEARKAFERLLREHDDPVTLEMARIAKKYLGL